MNIPAHELEAFGAVARTRNFSKAAEQVHITQPALSQRIQNLERALGQALLVRDRKETRLTDAGARLLRYCQAKDHLESELLAELVGASEGGLGGRLRVAGYSSVMESVIMPALAELLRKNPAVRFEFYTREMRDLPVMLETGEADFIVLDHALDRTGLETAALGHERYVLIRSARFEPRDVYLDHDPEDRITGLFSKRQGKGRRTIARCYVDDVHGLLNGVALGLGQAVVARHLVPKALPVRVVTGLKAVEVPVVLHYFRQAYYSNLQKAAIQAIVDLAPTYL